MLSSEAAAAAKAEQAALCALQTEIMRRDRHKAAGLIEVVELSEARVADAYRNWRRCSLHRSILTCQAMGGRQPSTLRPSGA